MYSHSVLRSKERSFAQVRFLNNYVLFNIISTILIFNLIFKTTYRAFLGGGTGLEKHKSVSFKMTNQNLSVSCRGKIMIQSSQLMVRAMALFIFVQYTVRCSF